MFEATTKIISKIRFYVIQNMNSISSPKESKYLIFMLTMDQDDEW